MRRLFRNFDLISCSLLRVRIAETDTEFTVEGKIAGLFRLLIRAGKDGLTKGEAVMPLGGLAPNIGGYIYKLKKKGACIESDPVELGPRLRVARYWLNCTVEVLQDDSDGR